MPTRSNRRLLDVAAAAGTVGLIGWISQGPPNVTPTAALRHSQTIPRIERPVQVRLEALSGRPSPVDGLDRDPFSTRRKVAVRASLTPPSLQAERAVLREVSYIPPTITAPFKFMGILQKRSGETWGIFADCAGYTRAAREGESVLGTWRVLRIGVESVFVESLDGHQLTMPMAGCGPRS